jgi:hypothetical protein
MKSALPSAQLLCNCTTSWLWPIFVLGTTVSSGPWPQCRVFMITLRHTTLGRNSLDEWSARRRGFYLTTLNTHSRHPCPGESRIRNPNNSGHRPRLRPRSHWDRRWPSVVRTYRRELNKYSLYPHKSVYIWLTVDCMNEPHFGQLQDLRKMWWKRPFDAKVAIESYTYLTYNTIYIYTYTNFLPFNLYFTICYIKQYILTL